MRKHAPRLHTDRYLGRQRYFLTICTFKRQCHFLDATIVEICLDHFLRIAAAEYMAVTAYCFMPDHVHLLAEGTEAAADMTRFVERAKQKTGYALRGVAEQQLWQPGWFDRILRESDDLKDALRYLLNNPVRAGLVENAADYRFSGSGVVSREALFESAFEIRASLRGGGGCSPHPT